MPWKIAGPDHLPAWSGVADCGGADDGGPVHLPYGDLTVIVLPQGVGLAVTIEIAANHDPYSSYNPAIVTSLVTPDKLGLLTISLKRASPVRS